MLELIFQGFMEWAYGLALECWEYFSSSLLDIMSMDYTMAVLFNCIAESESDLMLDPYLNTICAAV